MTAADAEELARAAAAVSLPGLDISLEDALVRIAVTPGGEDSVELRLEAGFPLAGMASALRAALAEALAPRLAGRRLVLSCEQKIRSHAVQGQLKPVPGIRNIVAVGSGKGGVGKSTTTVNLALALAADGARVGILDADIYGPSIPTMLGLAGQRPETLDGKSFEPLESMGLQVISIGFLVDQDKPVIWRGPMVTQALQQMLFQTNWRELDYLVVDLPPGTGDTQLTLTQKVPVSGAVIVTTPQDIALLDARRGLRMFEKVNVAVLGVVENMSLHICPACGHESALFGTGGGQRLAEETGVRLLGQLPLHAKIREQTDSGQPSVAAEPDGEIAAHYRRVARRLAVTLAARPVDRKAAFPDIVVETKS